ncbi:MAG: hypothetical protein PHE61_05090 [Candidatus Omnitrophica bacterium]|nr:hypothetical protein [Candidatus Omnitrophota bacterium]
MPYFSRIILFFLVIAVSLAFSAAVFAMEVESKHFDVVVYEGVDIYALLEKLNINYFRHIETIPSGSGSGIMLGAVLDAMYLEVSDVLDIHVYDFKINLEILPDRKAVNDVLRNFLPNDVDVPSYYYYEKNTIYVSFGDLRVGLLAHEIAHAIICHYFVVPPPPKAQEILSGYVEYCVNKAVSKG